MANAFFNDREMEGRKRWVEINLHEMLRGEKTIHFTTDPYELFDFDMTASTVLSYGEIKTVHRDYARYPNFQIDYGKLRNLQDMARQMGRVPYLVCFFDDVDVVWDISGIDLESRRYKAWCTSTTADYGKARREKDEVWLTIDEAIWSHKN